MDDAVLLLSQLSACAESGSVGIGVRESWIDKALAALGLTVN